MTMSIKTLSLKTLRHSDTQTLSHLYCFAKCRYAECRYAECRGALLDSIIMFYVYEPISSERPSKYLLVAPPHLVKHFSL
jgi:hypothetical protein